MTIKWNPKTAQRLESLQLRCWLSLSLDCSFDGGERDKTRGFELRHCLELVEGKWKEQNCLRGKLWRKCVSFSCLVLERIWEESKGEKSFSCFVPKEKEKEKIPEGKWTKFCNPRSVIVVVYMMIDRCEGGRLSIPTLLQRNRYEQGFRSLQFSSEYRWCEPTTYIYSENREKIRRRKKKIKAKIVSQTQIFR